MRSGGSTGDQKGRYCASLGHKQDDESGLIYMRARYYEPTSGRFISEDPDRNDGNYFTYCKSNPVNGVDSSGKETLTQAFYLGLIGTFLKNIMSMIAQHCFGKQFSVRDILDSAFGWLIDALCIGGLVKAFESSHKALDAVAFWRKAKFIGGGAFVFGGAIGIAVALHLGSHRGDIMTELWEQHAEEIGNGNGGWMF